MFSILEEVLGMVQSELAGLGAVIDTTVPSPL
jgi:hypothetical protein